MTSIWTRRLGWIARAPGSISTSRCSGATSAVCSTLGAEPHAGRHIVKPLIHTHQPSEPLGGGPGPETLDRLSFVKDANGAFAQTAEHDVVFVMRPTRMDQLRAVALAGETMPQKSTYFYPKLLSGLVFRSAE